jgi:hypothetical protein
MATALTIYQRKQAARRATADIERLAKTYQSGLFDTVQQQQNAFTAYQAQYAKQMAPYEAAVKQYTNVAVPAYQQQLQKYNQGVSEYEQQAAAYRARLNAFQKLLAEIEANPTEKVNAPFIQTPRAGLLFTIDGKQYSAKNLPEGYFLVETPRQVTEMIRGRPVTTTVIDKSVARQRSVPTFTEQPPTPPSTAMPTPPAPPGAPPNIPALDASPFEARRRELETTFKRELGERKSAKQNVVMRRISRGMLQGA